jgi:hypothetical protein
VIVVSYENSKLCALDAASAGFGVARGKSSELRKWFREEWKISSTKGHLVDALAPRGDEGRGTLR